MSLGIRTKLFHIHPENAVQAYKKDILLRFSPKKDVFLIMCVPGFSLQD